MGSRNGCSIKWILFCGGYDEVFDVCHRVFAIAECLNKARPEVKDGPMDRSKIVGERGRVAGRYGSLMPKVSQSLSVGAKGARGDSQIGNVEAICPYCGGVLEKKPERKKKCPYCKDFIFVVTRPSDVQEVLVRKEQVEEIAEQWMRERQEEGDR
jgi:hypothetical protein